MTPVFNAMNGTRWQIEVRPQQKILHESFKWLFNQIRNINKTSSAVLYITCLLKRTKNRTAEKMIPAPQLELHRGSSISVPRQSIKSVNQLLGRGAYNFEMTSRWCNHEPRSWNSASVWCSLVCARARGGGNGGTPPPFTAGQIARFVRPEHASAASSGHEDTAEWEKRH